MKITRSESRESHEQVVIEDSERRAVDYSRCEGILEVLEWAIEHGSTVMFHRHALRLMRRLVTEHMLAIENEVRGTEEKKP